MRLRREHARGALLHVVAYVVGIFTFNALAIAAFGAVVPDVTLISKIAPGVVSDTPGGPSRPASVSADGRYVVFTSEAANVIANQVDGNGAADVFLYDRVAGTTVLVSHVPGQPATAANRGAANPVISANGAFIVFVSAATDLVAGTDTNGANGIVGYDVFLYARATGTVTLVSHALGAPGTAGNAPSSPPSNAPNTAPAISADGAFIAFASAASNLVAGTGTNGGNGASGSDVFLYERATDTMTLVSHAAGAPGTAANGGSGSVSMSADGAYVAFASGATNLVLGGDFNRSSDVFLYERATGTVSLVSHVRAGANGAGSGASYSPVISADGAYVAFVSEADDLGVPPDPNGDHGSDVNGSVEDVFLYERATGTVTLVSHVPGDLERTANGASVAPVITADGGVVVFSSRATNLAGPGANPFELDLFRYDRATGVVTRLIHAPGTAANGGSGSASISADGSLIAFASVATNLLGGVDENRGVDVFVLDVATDSVTLVSHAAGSPGTPGRGPSDWPLISANGAVVVYRSAASDLTAEIDGNGRVDVFLHDRTTSATTLVSRRQSSSPSVSAGGDSQAPSVSADGRWVVFTSTASNLVANQVPPANPIAGGVDDPGRTDVYLHDRVTGTTTLVSHLAGAPTAAATGTSFDPVISADGAWVAFASTASDLVVGTDANEDGLESTGSAEIGSFFSETGPKDVDVFLYERATGIVTLVSHIPGAPTTTGNGPSGRPVISADGQLVAFVSTATDLAVDDANGGKADVFLYDRASGAVRLVSHAAGDPDTSANAESWDPAISADGSAVAFLSRATNMVSATDANGAGSDVFVYETATATNALVSRRRTTVTRGESDQPSISDDGRWIAFVSTAPNLVVRQEDHNNGADVFLHDRVTGTTTLVSHDPGGPAIAAFRVSDTATISADGTFVAFTSAATELVGISAPPPQSRRYLFVYERVTGKVTLVSHAAGAPGTLANDAVSAYAISANGGVVAFTSSAANLAAGTDTNIALDVFVWEQATGAITLVSHLPGQLGVAAARGTEHQVPAMSVDGSVIAFYSLTDNLVADDRNGASDVFAFAWIPETLAGADLVTTTISDPPAIALPGSRFAVTDTVVNQGNATAAAAMTRYYLSPVPRKTTASTLLSLTRRTLPLAAGEVSEGTRMLTVPTSLPAGTYYLLACADDLSQVIETDERNNCAVAATQLTAGLPDLIVTAVSDPPASASRGARFTITETVANHATFAAGASTTRYYLSLDTQKGTGDRMLSATRAVPALAAGATFPAPAPVTVLIPSNLMAGSYFVLACADDLNRVLESSESNNCTASAGQVNVP